MNLPYGNWGCQAIFRSARSCDCLQFCISAAFRERERLPPLGALNQDASTGKD
jgi:hypothetical protein